MTVEISACKGSFMNVVIKNGRVIDPANNVDENLDILVSEGKIAKLGKPGSVSGNGAQVVDAAGKLVVPGLIDMHVHLREPGYEYKETIEQGQQRQRQGASRRSAACRTRTP